jgi:chorismate synthase
MAARRACRSRREPIQPWLDKRRPGTSRYTTQRREADAVEILSGVFEGVTTGTPIQLEIRNTDQRSKDYGEIADKFRPGHADITYHEIRRARSARRRALLGARDGGAGGRGRRGARGAGRAGPG